MSHLQKVVVNFSVKEKGGEGGGGLDLRSQKFKGMYEAKIEFPEG